MGQARYDFTEYCELLDERFRGDFHLDPIAATVATHEDLGATPPAHREEWRIGVRPEMVDMPEDAASAILVRLHHELARYCQQHHLRAENAVYVGIHVIGQAAEHRDLPVLEDGNHMFTDFWRLREHHLVDPIGRILTSNEYALDFFRLRIVVMFFPQDGDGRGFGDGMCLYESLVLGMDNLKHPDKGTRLHCETNKPQLRRLARELKTNLGHGPEPDENGAEMAVVGDFVRAYPEYKVTVFTEGMTSRDVAIDEFRGAEWIPPSTAKGKAKDFYLAYEEQKQHYKYVKKDNGRVRERAWKSKGRRNLASHVCESCGELFPFRSHEEKKAFAEHSCPGRRPCEVCLQQFDEDHMLVHQIEVLEMKPEDRWKLVCKGCQQQCSSVNCLAAHAEWCMPPCEKCGKQHSWPQADCGAYRCFGGCQKRYTVEELREHRDYFEGPKKPTPNPFELKPVKPGKRKRVKRPTEQWAFDFETLATPDPDPRWDDQPEVAPGLRRERPVIARLYKIGLQNLEGGPIEILTGEAGIVAFLERFCKPIKEKSEEPQCILWAHNGGRFDFRVLYNELMSRGYDETSISKGTIFKDALIMQMKCGRSTFRDSCLHIKRALRDLPAMFGFAASAMKGHFPHKFNTPENASYVGPLPPLEMYDPQGLCSQKECDELKAWHAEESLKYADGSWDANKQMDAYLADDVKVLAMALNAYRKLMVEHGAVDPLTKMTLPGVAMRSYQEKYLTSDQIPILRNFPELKTEMSLNEDKLIRPAYFGGNTNLRKLRCKLTRAQYEQGWRIKMIDVVSLYPSVMYGCKYPTEDLTLQIFEDTQPSHTWLWNQEGAAKLVINFPETNPNPPFHPILPGKVRGKLECDLTYHPEPRVFTLPLIREALRQGYTVQRIDWTLTSSDSSNLIFRPYIKKFYEIKLLFNGPPNIDWHNRDEAAEFVRRTEETSGVKLCMPGDVDPLAWWDANKNKAVANIGKLMLNSLYGKFGEAGAKGSVEFTSDPYEEIRLAKKSKNAYFHRSTTAFHMFDEDQISDGYSHINPLIAAYVTDHARIKLNRAMECVGERCLYHDTDSVAYLHVPGAAEPEQGPYLGCWDDDLGGKQAHAFVAIAPKSYALVEFVPCAEGEGILEEGWGWVTEKVHKLRMKGVKMTLDNQNRLGWRKMWGMAGLMLDECVDSALVDEDGVWVRHGLWSWKRAVCEFTIQDTVKRVKADKSMLKGLLAKNGTLYPHGWDRWHPEIEYII